MNIEFNSKRAVVTGAGKGIGRAIAIALAKGGAETIAISRTQSDLDSLKQECAGIQTVCVDVGEWDSTREAVTDLGPVDLLVNNAGVSSLQSCLEATPEEFDRIMNINVKAAINISQVVAKGMVDRKSGGSIVNVSSLASMRVLKDHLLYSASKGALDSVTKTMALEWGPHQIRVNSVNPTVAMTDMGKKAWSAPEKSGPMLARIPQNKFVEVNDIVNAVMYLLSDKSDMINGAILPIDGGFATA